MLNVSVRAAHTVPDSCSQSAWSLANAVQGIIGASKSATRNAIEAVPEEDVTEVIGSEGAIAIFATETVRSKRLVSNSTQDNLEGNASIRNGEAFQVTALD